MRRKILVSIAYWLCISLFVGLVALAFTNIPVMALGIGSIVASLWLGGAYWYRQRRDNRLTGTMAEYVILRMCLGSCLLVSSVGLFILYQMNAPTLPMALCFGLADGMAFLFAYPEPFERLMNVVRSSPDLQNLR